MSLKLRGTICGGLKGGPLYYKLVPENSAQQNLSFILVKQGITLQLIGYLLVACSLCSVFLGKLLCFDANSTTDDNFNPPIRCLVDFWFVQLVFEMLIFDYAFLDGFSIVI